MYFELHLIEVVLWTGTLLWLGGVVKFDLLVSTSWARLRSWNATRKTKNMRKFFTMLREDNLTELKDAEEENSEEESLEDYIEISFEGEKAFIKEDDRELFEILNNSKKPAYRSTGFRTRSEDQVSSV